MARIVYRVTYLIVLAVMLTHLLVYPAGWEEERLPVMVLTALHVREFAATTRALWHTGRRWHRRWKRRRQDRRAKLHASPSWRAWVAQLLPDPEPLPWAEQAAFTALKRGGEGLFKLLPEATCAALFRRLRWLGGLLGREPQDGGTDGAVAPTGLLHAALPSLVGRTGRD